MPSTFKPYRNELRRVFVIYALTPVILLAGVVYAAIFVWGYRLIEARTYGNAREVAETLRAELSAYKTAMEALSADPDLRGVMNEMTLDSPAQEDVERRRGMYEKLYAVVNARLLKSRFQVFDGQGRPVMSDTHTQPAYVRDWTESRWGFFRRMSDQPKVTVGVLNSSYEPMRGWSVFSLGRAVLDEKGVPVGYLVFDWMEKDLQGLLHRSSGSDMLVTDAYSNVVVGTSGEFIDPFGKLHQKLHQDANAVSVGDETYCVRTAQVAGERLAVYAISATGFFTKAFYSGAAFLAVLFGAIIAFMLLWSKKIAARKTKSIDDIVHAIRHIHQGNLDTVLTTESNDEFRLIASSYNKMLLDIKGLLAQNKEELQRAMTAEIKQLESQFNPHMLFNTLENVRCMIKLDPAAACKIIVHLSSLLRYSINNTIHDVRLIDDLEYSKHSLEILKYRFPERFFYSIVTDNEAQECMVPKLILQPIIENAVEHGFKDTDHISIEVRAHIARERLIITISDDGQGMSDDELQRVRDLLQQNNNATNRIGLYNAHRRLVLLHGPDYGLSIFSRQGQGTCVRIELPVEGGPYVESAHRGR